jgi:hypothetical protein
MTFTRHTLVGARSYSPDETADIADADATRLLKSGAANIAIPARPAPAPPAAKQTATNAPKAQTATAPPAASTTAAPPPAETAAAAQ